MQRPMTQVLSPAEVVIPSGTLTRLAPLWRHGAWLAVMFLVITTSLAVRLDVQQLHKDLERNERLHREALVHNERLRLEMDVRRRAAAIEGLAVQMSVGSDAPLVEVPR